MGAKGIAAEEQCILRGRGTRGQGKLRHRSNMDSQIQKGLISYGPESGLYPEDDGEGM